MQPGLTGAVLTWKSPATLRSTLTSYRKRGLDRLLDQRLVLVQEGGPREISIAEEFGWTAIAPSENLGIGGGYQRLLNECDTSHFLFLECDWKLSGDPASQITASVDLIDRGCAAVVRLRSTTRPGFPLGVLRIQNREQLHPDWLIESVFYEPQPWRVFPRHIQAHDHKAVRFALARPVNAGWSNNPHLARTEYLRALLAQDSAHSTNIENAVTAGSYGDGVLIAHAPGIFTHARLDGPAINVRGLKYNFDQRFRWATRGIRRRRRVLSTSACPLCGLPLDDCVAGFPALAAH